MKIHCDCGAWVIDSTDDLPHKAHLFPDQGYYNMVDAIDDVVIDQLAEGTIDRDTAYMRLRELVSGGRLVWQCSSCGQLFVDDPTHTIRSFAPVDEPPAREVLRRTVRRDEPPARDA